MKCSVRVGIFLLLFTLLLSSCSRGSDQEGNLLEAKVHKVIDGDTISVEVGEKRESIRMLLIDTPETHHPNKPVQPYGKKATEFAKNTLDNKAVKLEIGTTKRDKYGRILAYVYIDDQMYNELVVKEGLARVAYVYPPNDKYVERLKEAEHQAQKKKIGIWSKPNYVQEDGFHVEEGEQRSGNISKKDSKQESPGLPYAPGRPDRDCSDFSYQTEAQTFFELAGGPEKDPHRLDRDGDGSVCETLP